MWSHWVCFIQKFSDYPIKLKYCFNRSFFNVFQFSYKGLNCEIDIDECEDNPCLNRGTCYNIYGSYVCACPAGFEGQNCELNLNECISNPCFNGGQCLDDVGSYKCNCTGTGYAGEHCELLPRSNSGNNLSSGNNVALPVTIGALNCEHLNCPAPGSMCVRDSQGPHCICRPGYVGAPPDCVPNFCVSNPCIHGGTCINHRDRFECICSPEWKGKFSKNITNYRYFLQAFCFLLSNFKCLFCKNFYSFASFI